jgi:hypothetical protein
VDVDLSNIEVYWLIVSANKKNFARLPNRVGEPDFIHYVPVSLALPCPFTRHRNICEHKTRVGNAIENVGNDAPRQDRGIYPSSSQQATGTLFDSGTYRRLPNGRELIVE